MSRVRLFLVKFFVVIFLVVIFLTGYSIYLDKKIDKLYDENKQMVNHINGLAEKDKGNSLISRSLVDGNILLMGSSELTSPVPENIKNFFPNNFYAYDISTVGHATVQNALHAMNLGANSDSIQDNPVMIVESLQWFMNDEINVPGFFSNFSELQFYEFLNNKKISKDNKIYLCKRYMELENSNDIRIKPQLLSKFSDGYINKLVNLFPSNIVMSNITNKQTFLLARLYSSENLIEKILYYVMKPYYWIRYKILNIRDKYYAYQWLNSLGEIVSKESIDIDWNDEYLKAEKTGKESCTNNDIFVYDEYYDTYLKEKWTELKNGYDNVELMTSNEWNDFEFFLNVCDDLGIKPYIVIMSTNGLYYDYTGMNKARRDELYDKIDMLSSNHKFDVLNLKDYEYNPYFYCDVMHLGWKGWTYVTQKAIEHFSK